jgi:hypothetical protein
MTPRKINDKKILAPMMRLAVRKTNNPSTMRKSQPVFVTCRHCGGQALGNYKHNPHFGKCTECHKVFGY